MKEKIKNKKNQMKNQLKILKIMKMKIPYIKALKFIKKFHQ